MDQINVAGVDVMTRNQKIQNLISANKILIQDVLTNESFTQEDKELVRDKMYLLTLQLAFWVDEENEERFFYDLKDHINWMLKNFS